MNWLLVAIMIMFFIGMLSGALKGGLRIAVSLGATLATFLLVVLLSPYVSKMVYEHTPIGNAVEDQIYATASKLATTSTIGELGIDEEKIREKLAEHGVTETALNRAGITIEDILEGRVDRAKLAKNGISDKIIDFYIAPESVEPATEPVEDEGSEETTEIDISRQAQRLVIENAQIPEIFKELLKENNNSEIYGTLGATSFVQYMAKFLAKTIINIIVFLALFVVLTIVIRSIIFALDIVTELPVVGVINRLTGMIIGLILALLVINLLFIVIVLLFQTTFGQNMYELIENSQFLTFLYEHNFLLQLATSTK